MRQFPRSVFTPQQVELVLADAEGAPWRLSMTKGSERFIGFYPRLPGFAGDAPLLTYRDGAPAAF